MRFRLAHYDIREELGHGGMGVVYRARDTRLGRQLAIKVLPSLLRSDPERRGRFLREARAAAALNHPNIATVYEVGEAVLEPVVEEDDDDQATEIHRTTCLYIAMEYVAGQDLHELLGGEPLPVPRCLDFAIQVADALDTAHREGIIHRDLKPRNIRLTPEGRIKILDFGLAKVLQEDARMSSMLGGLGGDTPGTATPGDVRTVEGMIVGTVPYMAPEQVEGRDVDARSDLFAFGIVLYQMLAGQVPFPGPGLVQYVRALGAGPPGPPSAQNADVPVELDRVTLRLLARESGERYPSAGAVLADLRSLVGSEVGLESSVLPSVPVNERRRVREPRIRRWLQGAITVLTVLTVIVTISVVINRGSRESRGRFSVALEDPKIPDGASNETELMCESLVSSVKDSLTRIETLRFVGPAVGSSASLRIQVDCYERTETFGISIRVQEGEGNESIWVENFSPRGGFSERAAGEVSFQTARALATIENQRREWGAQLPGEPIQALKLYHTALDIVESANGADDLDRSKKSLERALVFDPTLHDADVLLSEVAVRLWRYSAGDGDRQEALVRLLSRCVERLEAADRNPWMYRLARSRLHRVKGELVEAVEILIEGEDFPDWSSDSIFSELGLALWWRSSAASSTGDMERAETYLRRSVQARPGYWRHYLNLGAIQAREQRFELAREAYRLAVELASNEVYLPVEQLANFELEQSGPQVAKALFESIPDEYFSSSAPGNYGRILFYIGRFSEAEYYFQRAAAEMGSAAVWWGDIGYARLAQGRSEAAGDAFRQAIGLLQGEDGGSHTLSKQEASLLPVYLAMAGRCDESMASLRSFESAFPEASLGQEDHLRRARTLAQCGQTVAAREALDKSLLGGLRPWQIQVYPELQELSSSGSAIR